MKFYCEQCHTKYAIDDSRVRGKVLKIRCKACQHLMTVRDPLAVHHAAAAAVAPWVAAAPVSQPALADAPVAQPVPADDGEHTLVSGAPSGMAAVAVAAAGGSTEWFVSFDGEQEGPLAIERARERVEAERQAGKEAFAWRDGFSAWLPVDKVPELAPPPARRPPPPPRPPAMPPAQRVGPARAPVPMRKPDAVASARMAPAGPVASVVEPAHDQTADRSSFASAPAVLESVPREHRAAQRAGMPPRLALLARDLSPDQTPEESEPIAPPERGVLPHLVPPSPPPPPEESSAAAAPAEAALTSATAAASPAPALPEAASTGGALAAAAVASLETPPAPSPGPAEGAKAAGRHPLDLAPSFPPGLPASVPVASPRRTMAYALAACVAIIVVLLGALGYQTLHRRPDVVVGAVTIGGDPEAPKPPAVNDRPIGIIDTAPPAAAPAPPAAPQPVVPAIAARAGTAPARHHPAPRQVVAKVDPAARPAPPPPRLTADEKRLADVYRDDEKSTPAKLPQLAAVEHTREPVSDGDIMGVVTRNKRMVQVCFERALKHDNSLKNLRVDVELKIGLSGAVTGVVLADPRASNSELGTCLKQTIRRWHFPSQDSEYQTAFPLLLQAAQ